MSTNVRRLTGKKVAVRPPSLAEPRNPWDRARIVQRTGKADGGEENRPQKGAKTPDGEKKQFLTSMDPDVIRRIKAAAALRDQRRVRAGKKRPRIGSIGIRTEEVVVSTAAFRVD